MPHFDSMNSNVGVAERVGQPARQRLRSRTRSSSARCPRAPRRAPASGRARSSSRPCSWTGPRPPTAAATRPSMPRGMMSNSKTCVSSCVISRYSWSGGSSIGSTIRLRSGSANASTPSGSSPPEMLLRLELALRLEQDERHAVRQVVLQLAADVLVRVLRVRRRPARGAARSTGSRRSRSGRSCRCASRTWCSGRGSCRSTARTASGRSTGDRRAAPPAANEPGRQRTEIDMRERRIRIGSPRARHRAARSPSPESYTRG